MAETKVVVIGRSLETCRNIVKIAVWFCGTQIAPGTRRCRLTPRIS